MDALDVAFTEGTVYRRTLDITGKFGGSGQSGIAPSAKVPMIFIFTGEEGEQYGYRDEWDPAGQVFTYTGEGQIGPMTYVRGNAAIRDHVKNGRAIHLFKKVSKSGGLYSYQGEMQCASTSVVSGPDKAGDERSIIQFELVRVRALPDSNTTTGPISSNSARDLAVLRAAAYAAIKPPGTKVKTESTRSVYDRSRAVVDYVLARADGKCECCGTPSPFVRLDGSPYLESHHTDRLSDNGLDSPDHVAGVCPTCHRRIHYGLGGQDLNAQLRGKILELETISLTGQ